MLAPVTRKNCSRGECESVWRKWDTQNRNGYAERVIRTIKEEEVYLNEYRSCEEAIERIGNFIESVYNRKRIPESTGKD